MWSLKIAKDNVSEKILGKCISGMVRLYKNDLDGKLRGRNFRIYEDDYELLERLLTAKNREDAIEEMKIISFVCGGDPEIDPENVLVKFNEYIVRILYLSEFEPDKLCLKALEDFQDGFRFEYGRNWPEEAIQIEIHKDIEQEALQRVSAEMRPYIQEEVLRFKERCERSQRMAEKIIEEIMKVAIIKKSGKERNEVSS